MQLVGKLFGIGQVDPRDGIMRAGSFARWAAGLTLAKIALYRGEPFNAALARVARRRKSRFHADVSIWTSAGAGATANAGCVVDDDIAAAGMALDRAGRAINHANRISAMHTGVCDHEIVMGLTLPDKPRNIVMCGGAGTNAVIAIHAAIRVDHHGAGTV